MTTSLALKDINLQQDSGSLVDFSIDLFPGELHALVGSETSGKICLSALLCGDLVPESGQFLISGQNQRGINVRNNQRKGIQVVHHSNAFFNNLTIADTLYYDTNKFLLIGGDRGKKTQKILMQYNLDYNASTRMGDLPESDRYFIVFIRALLKKPKVLVLDETLSLISPARIPAIVELLKDIQATGTAILWITSRFDEVDSFADKVSIMRNGKLLLTETVESMDKTNLLKLCFSQFESPEESDQSIEFNKLMKYNEVILQQLPVSLIVIDKDEQIKLANLTAKEYFHIDDLSNKPRLHDMFTGFDETVKLIHSAVQEKKDRVFYNIELKNAVQPIIANVRLLPIYDGQAFIGTLVIIEDISEQEQLRSQVELSEKLASVGLLAAGVAHEINNPLEIIYNYLSFLKRKHGDEKTSTILDDIEEEIEQIKQIVSNLVTFSTHSEISDESFCLQTLMGNMLNLIKYDPKYENIKTMFSTGAEKLTIKADQREIRQVILNLIKNSYEAMPTGGGNQYYVRASRT